MKIIISYSNFTFALPDSEILNSISLVTLLYNLEDCNINQWKLCMRLILSNCNILIASFIQDVKEGQKIWQKNPLKDA